MEGGYVVVHLHRDNEAFPREVYSVEEAAKSQGVAGAVAERIQVSCFDDLDGPVVACTSLDISTPVSRSLELAALVSDEQIVSTVRDVASRRWDEA